MPMSENAFKAWINEAEKHSRFRNYKTYEDYWLGNYDEIAFAQEMEAALSVDLAIKANMCFPIINAKVQYILGEEPVNIVASGEDVADETLKDAEKWLTDIYEANNLHYNNMLKLIRGMSIKGDGYIKLALPEEGKKGALKDTAKVRVIDPKFVLPKYRSDDYEELELVAIKSYDYNDKGDLEWTAQVWYEDVLELWTLDSADPTREDQDAVDHEWWRDEVLDNPFGFIPVVHFPNLINQQAYGISDLHNVTTLQCALIKYLTDQAITADYQAYKRLFITGAMTIPGKEWAIDPGTITEIPDAEAKIHEIDAGDLKAFLEAVDQTIDLMCLVTQTPRIALSKPQGGGAPSGIALEIQFLPLKSKTAETKAILKAGLLKLNGMLLQLGAEMDGQSFGEIKADVNYVGGLPIDMAALVEQHTKQIQNKTLSRESAMQEEGVEDTETEQDKIDSEDFANNAIRRIGAETDQLRTRIENGEDLTAKPRPGEVSARERARARENPPIRGES
jgi:hypothetical protein